jgi:2-oxoglutarate dehydrogenase E2 component (dihydrolipoamide succinyltransferase)
MSVNIVVPSLGESITEAVIERWLKKPGEAVEKDEPVVSIESDKATVEVPSPEAGVLLEVKKGDGEAVKIGEVIALLDETAAGARAPAAPAAAAAPGGTEAGGRGADLARASPVARKLLEEHGIAPGAIRATGPGGRIRKEDVLRHLEGAPAPAPRADGGGRPVAPAPAPKPAVPAAEPAPAPGAREERVVAMSPIRRTIARRLVEAQHTAAMLTTFNEVDMSRVMALRTRWQDAFVKRHGVKLGFMSFFVKASIEALKAFPSVNAELRGDTIVYKNYYDIGVAVGGGKGLTVPVIRDADTLSFAELELRIADFGKRAAESRLKLEELQGGTFTITNGGVYGSLLSTPILNPPQSGILGMHKIEKRPVVVDDRIEIRPMMYLALTYDHRQVDGREAVSFLVKIKECLEAPERILLEV